MEKENKNDKWLIIVLGIVVAVVCLVAGYILGLGILGNKESKPKEETNNNTYGFAYVEDGEKNYKIVALNSQGEDTAIGNITGEISLFLKNNKVLLSNLRGNSDYLGESVKLYYIDLNKPYKIEKIYEADDISQYFDLNDDYLVIENEPGMTVVNLKNNQTTKLLEEIFVNDVFLVGDKIYHEEMTDDMPPVGEYYVINVDGTNKQAISEEEFKTIEKQAGYRADYYTDELFIKNGKKITIDNTNNNVLVDDKIIYTQEDKTHQISFRYIDKSNAVAFEDLTFIGWELSKSDSYIYHLDTEELETVDYILPAFGEVLLDK